jgi:two-component system nitrogen regulation sensor histidine kinase NtrY
MVADVRSAAAGIFSRVAAVGRWPETQRALTVGLLVAAFASGIATYLSITGAFSIPRSPHTVLLFLLLDLVFLLMLAAIVAWRLVALWLERRRGLIGARLHVRLVLWFGLIAMGPTFIVATFSVMFFAFGMDIWFSESVRTAVKDSLLVSQAYLREHQESVGYETLAMATDLKREEPLIDSRRDRFERLMTLQGRLRSLDEAAIIARDGRVLAAADLTFLEPADLMIPADKFEAASRSDVVILSGPTSDHVRAMVRLDDEADTFLVTSRAVDARVIQHMDTTAGAAALYEQLEGRRLNIQTIFSLIFIVIALLLLFGAIWGALIFATKLVRPISTLVNAAGRIGAGDLGTRVPEGDPGDEIGVLSQAFNRMTQQIESQRNELIDANRQLEERRRFMEVVLAGVSAGVIGLDEQGCTCWRPT